MTVWLICIALAAAYGLALVAFSRLGGLGAVADGLQEWGCAASELCRRPPRT
jgi:hypothetical protein